MPGGLGNKHLLEEMSRKRWMDEARKWESSASVGGRTTLRDGQATSSQVPSYKGSKILLEKH